MYKENFVVAIKTKNGKILRELDESVTLPFGEEYSIILKNLNSRKAVVNISIDGQDVLDNDQLLIKPNSETELKGFLTGNIVKNRFKFIKKTKEISDYRGDRVDDSLIRVEYRFEKKCVTERVDIEYHNHEIPYHPHDISYYDHSRKLLRRAPHIGTRIVDRSGTDNSNSRDYSNISCYNFSSDLAPTASKTNLGKVTCTSSSDLGICDIPKPEEGITVKGSKTTQHFTEAYVGELEESSSVIVLKLKGYTTKQEYVVVPITVKTKLTCETCGKKSKSSAKFCARCGTSLV